MTHSCTSMLSCSDLGMLSSLQDCLNDIRTRMSSNFLQFLVISRVSEDVTFLCVCVPLVQQVFSKIILSPFCYTYRKGPLSSLTPVKYTLESPLCTLFIPLCRAGNSRDRERRGRGAACSLAVVTFMFAL